MFSMFFGSHAHLQVSLQIVSELLALHVATLLLERVTEEIRWTFTTCNHNVFVY